MAARWNRCVRSTLRAAVAARAEEMGEGRRDAQEEGMAGKGKARWRMQGGSTSYDSFQRGANTLSRKSDPSARSIQQEGVGILRELMNRSERVGVCLRTVRSQST